MASNIQKQQILSLYKSLMRESQKFPNYNFRCYAIRRVRDSFKANKMTADTNLVKKEVDLAKDNLEILKRQVIIGDMYKTEKLVVENLQ